MSNSESLFLMKMTNPMTGEWDTYYPMTLAQGVILESGVSVEAMLGEIKQAASQGVPPGVAVSIGSGNSISGVDDSLVVGKGNSLGSPSAPNVEILGAGVFGNSNTVGSFARKGIMVIGQNVSPIGTTPNNSDNTNDILFAVGNGTDESKSTALKITNDGSVHASGTFNSSGADYAVYFEWADGNPEEEDRVGLFVAHDEKDPTKIRITQSDKDDIIGVVSANPAIVEDSGGMVWNGKYQKDVFGRVITEEVKVPIQTVIGNAGKVTIGQRIEIRPKINPSYNPTTGYIPRDKRPEWAPISWVGKICVKQDGTLVEGEWCRPSKDGKAVSSSKKVGVYKVMKVINSEVAYILMK